MHRLSSFTPATRGEIFSPPDSSPRRAHLNAKLLNQWHAHIFSPFFRPSVKVWRIKNCGTKMYLFWRQTQPSYVFAVCMHLYVCSSSQFQLPVSSRETSFPWWNLDRPIQKDQDSVKQHSSAKNEHIASNPPISWRLECFIHDSWMIFVNESIHIFCPEWFIFQFICSMILIGSEDMDDCRLQPSGKSSGLKPTFSPIKDEALGCQCLHEYAPLHITHTHTHVMHFF